MKAENEDPGKLSAVGESSAVVGSHQPERRAEQMETDFY